MNVLWSALRGNHHIGKSVRLFGKKLAGSCAVYRLTQRPILIFSTRRSGSTLLMHMIHSQPGVDYVDEPFNLWRLHPHLNRLPYPMMGKFTTVTDTNEEQLERYTRDLLTGRIRFRHRGNIIDPGRSLIVKRLVIKDINVTPLIDWFYQRFDVDVIYLVRHPCAVSKSLGRRRWKSIADVYLNDKVYLKTHLSEELLRYIQGIMKKGTPLQQYVIEWCFDNLVPLHQYKERPWLVLPYEEMVVRPKIMVDMISLHLGLTEPERMAQCIYTPSRTSTKESKKIIQEQGPQSLVSRWIKGMKPVELAQAQEVLDAFNINIYRADSPFPNPELCHFGHLEDTLGRAML